FLTVESVAAIFLWDVAAD
ncbi:hypothetical protein Tco_0087110, partial [Tanacetum coccineum]